MLGMIGATIEPANMITGLRLAACLVRAPTHKQWPRELKRPIKNYIAI